MTAPDSDLHRWKLPRGRHGLSSEVVAQSQRERLLAAVVRVSAEQTYTDTSVAEILKVAGVGRESFYKHFANKETCFLAAIDLLTDDLEAHAGEAFRLPGAWPHKVRRALLATLQWLARDTEIARVMTIELATAGPVVSQRWLTVQGRVVALFDEEPAHAKGSIAAFPSLNGVAVGATFAHIYEIIALGNTLELPGHLAGLTFELLLPYLGEEAAGRERLLAEEDLLQGDEMP